jgi:hypothetical protein
MALKSKGFKVEVALDNRLVNQPKEYTVFKSGNDVTIQNTTANTYTNSSLTWNILPPSGVWLDRRFMLQFKGRYTLNCSSPLPGGWSGCVLPDGNGGLSGVDGLRWFPVQSQCQNISVQINNSTITTTPNLYLEPLMRYGFDGLYEDTWLSVAPSMHDQAQTYARTFQTNRNPLGDLLSNPLQCPRGAITYTVVSNTATQAVIDVSWVEHFIGISPMLFPNEFATGLWDINKMNVTFNMQANMSNSWSHDATNGAVIDSIQFQFLEAPIFTMWQISTVGGVLEPPTDKILPYHEIDVYQNDGPSLAAGQTVTKTLDNLRLDGTPSKIYVFARKNLNSFSYNDCDAYAYISNVSVNFGTKTSLLSGLPPESVYQMCVNNGLKYSWQEYKSFQGSVLCIDFSSDISMDYFNAPGLSDQTQITIQITYQNIAPVSVQHTIYQCILYEGLIDYSLNQAQTFANVLSPGDITNDQILSASKSRAAHMNLNFMGGTFKESARKAFNKAVDIGKKYGPTAAKIAKQYGPGVVSAVSPRIGAVVKTLLGQGLSEQQVYNRLKAMGYPAKEIKAAGISGGRVKRLPAIRGRGLSGGQLIDDEDSDELLESGSNRLSLHDRY